MRYVYTPFMHTQTEDHSASRKYTFRDGAYCLRDKIPQSTSLLRLKAVRFVRLHTLYAVSGLTANTGVFVEMHGVTPLYNFNIDHLLLVYMLKMRSRAVIHVSLPIYGNPSRVRVWIDCHSRIF